MPVNSFENYPMNWKPTLESNQKPIYIALANQLKNDIEKGILPPGTKLPPQRELADYLDINLSTITRAFKLCEEKGLLCSVVGRGTFVSSNVVSNGMIDILSPDTQVIEMGALIPNPDVEQIITTTLREMTQEPDFYKTLQYNQIPYTDIQFIAGKKWMSYFSLDIQKSNLLYSNGSQNAIFSVLAALFKRGDKIATMSITYPGLKLAASILGIQLIPIPTYDGYITKQSLEYVKNNHNIQGFYFIPDYNNPTNEMLSLKTRKLIAEFSETNKLPIIEDAIYALFTPSPIPPIATFAKNYGILISSVSKIMSPGLRLALMFVPEQFHSTINHSLYAMQISPSSLTMHIFTRLVCSNLFDKIRALRIDDIRNRYELLVQMFDSSIINADKYSPICWMQLPGEQNPDEFEQLCLANNLRICSASRFMVGNTTIPNAIRISLISEHSYERYREGLIILSKCLM